MSDDWITYQKYVLDKLETLQVGQDLLRGMQSEILVEMALLKARVRLWGAVAGAVGGILAASVPIIMTKIFMGVL